MSTEPCLGRPPLNNNATGPPVFKACICRKENLKKISNNTQLLIVRMQWSVKYRDDAGEFYIAYTFSWIHCCTLC